MWPIVDVIGLSSQMRKHYWVVGVRALVKSISRSCMFCKKMFARLCHQKMSDLLPERLEAGHKPFTNIGVDCFGPFLLKRGIPVRAQVGKLVVACRWSAVYSTQP